MLVNKDALLELGKKKDLRGENVERKCGGKGISREERPLGLWLSSASVHVSWVPVSGDVTGEGKSRLGGGEGV